MKRNTVLIGMPGVGKSTIGVVLAKIVGYKFIDADILIQEREGKLLKDIIREKGIHKFIQIEDDVNASIHAEQTIIATGGSVVYGEKAMEHLKEISTVVYLKLGYEQLSQRIDDIKGRGVVLREGQDLLAIFNERTPLYEKYADIVIEEDGLNLEQTIQKIIESFNNYR